MTAVVHKLKLENFLTKTPNNGAEIVFKLPGIQQFPNLEFRIVMFPNGEICQFEGHVGLQLQVLEKLDGQRNDGARNCEISFEVSVDLVKGENTKFLAQRQGIFKAPFGAVGMHDWHQMISHGQLKYQLGMEGSEKGKGNDDDEIVFLIHLSFLTVLEVELIKSGFLQPDNWKTPADLIVVTVGEKVFSVRQIVLSASPVLKKLIKSLPIEANKQLTIEQGDHSIESFIDFFHILRYGMRNDLDNTAEDLFSLAREYQVPKLEVQYTYSSS